MIELEGTVRGRLEHALAASLKAMRLQLAHARRALGS